MRLTRKQISQKVHNLIRKWDRQGFSERSINSGNCDSFAQELLEACGNKGNTFWGSELSCSHFFPKYIEQDEHFDRDAHCFYRYGSWYFDSECPQGVSSPILLPFYQRIISARNNKEDLTFNRRNGKLVA